MFKSTRKVLIIDKYHVFFFLKSLTWPNLTKISDLSSTPDYKPEFPAWLSYHQTPDSFKKQTGLKVILEPMIRPSPETTHLHLWTFSSYRRHGCQLYPQRRRSFLLRLILF